MQEKSKLGEGKSQQKTQHDVDESQAKEEKKRKKDERRRQYAFLVYPDSAYEDWIERLDSLHVEALISPLHDRDVNPDGSQKKPHWHVMLMFDGKKSLAQIDEIREKCLGPNFNRALEDIGSMRGYGRYMCHLDNPEKAQYAKSGVRALGGVDYDALILLPSDDAQMLVEVNAFIREKDIQGLGDFIAVAAVSNPEWIHFLNRKQYLIVQMLRAQFTKARCAAALAGYVPVKQEPKKGSDHENQD